MNLRIAFTGAHGTGKSTLAEYTEELLTEVHEGESVRLGSATRAVRDRCGVEINEETEDFTQLYSQIQRRFWTFDYKDIPFLVSERCGLDEVYYQQYLVDKRMKELTGGIVLPDEVIGEKKVKLQFSNLMTNVLLQHAIIELQTYWTFVYFIKPHPGVAIGRDPDRSQSEEFQRAINEAAVSLIPQVRQFPGFETKIIDLPTELGEAKSFLKDQQTRWSEIVELEESLEAPEPIS